MAIKLWSLPFGTISAGEKYFAITVDEELLVTKRESNSPGLN